MPRNQDADSLIKWSKEDYERARVYFAAAAYWRAQVARFKSGKLK